MEKFKDAPAYKNLQDLFIDLGHIRSHILTLIMLPFKKASFGHYQSLSKK